MIVTFDFDITLAVSGYDPEGQCIYKGPNKPLVAAFRRHVEAGDQVSIVTTRMQAFEGLTDHRSVEEFLQEQQITPVQVVFTEGRPKAPFLVALGSQLHYDDNPDEAAGLPAGIEFRLVNDGLAPRPGTWAPTEA